MNVVERIRVLWVESYQSLVDNAALGNLMPKHPPFCAGGRRLQPGGSPVLLPISLQARRILLNEITKTTQLQYESQDHLAAF